MIKKIIRKLAENPSEVCAFVYYVLCITVIWIGFWGILVAFFGAVITTNIVEFIENKITIKEGLMSRHHDILDGINASQEIAKQPMRMKNLFLFSLSVAILCVCTSGFLLGKSNKAEKKRARLDEYYNKELIGSCSIFYDSDRSSAEKIYSGLAWIEETEANMLKDGYDRAEINSIKMKVIKEILLRRIHKEE